MTLMVAMLALGCDAGAQTPAETTDDPSSSPPAPAVAQTNPLDEWVVRLRQADAALRSGDYATGGATAQAVLEEMTGAIQGGNRAAPLMGMASLLRAVAAAGLERADEAMWHWYVAQSLHPDYAGADLDAYGAAGERLRAGAAADRGAAGAIVDLTQPELADPSIVPPERLTGSMPAHPTSLAAACIEGRVAVRALVEVDGTTAQPSLIEATGGPPMVVAALEAMRDWTFRPATLDGRAIPAFYNLAINLELEDCERPVG